MLDIYGDMPMQRSVTVEPILSDFIPHVQRIFEQHGGCFEVHNMLMTAHFPSGTIKRFIWPAVMSWRYDVIFPDGYEITEVSLRDGRHAFGYDPNEFPSELREKYAYLFP